jgi:hypothetical protein
MIRKLVAVALFSISLTAANGKPAQARNEDVPKGPVAAPSQGNTKPTDSKAPTDSLKTGDKKSAPSGSSSNPGGGGQA